MKLHIIKFNGETYWGFEECPRWLKQKYIDAVNGICKDCKKKKPLEPHRVIRGVDGGLYTVCPVNHPLNNVKMLCHECHEKYNYSKRCPY